MSTTKPLIKFGISLRVKVLYNKNNNLIKESNKKALLDTPISFKVRLIDYKG